MNPGVVRPAEKNGNNNAVVILVTEKNAKCLKPSVHHVVRILPFRLNQLVIDQFIAGNVSRLDGSN